MNAPWSWWRLQFDLDWLKAFTIFRDKNEWCNHLLMVRISRKLICPRLACDDNFDLRYRMQATDAWCLYDSFLCERVKKETRKRNKKTGKQSSVPPFIFIANAKRAALMFALKICERRKIVCVRERERKKYKNIYNEKKLQREREREKNCDIFQECSVHKVFWIFALAGSVLSEAWNFAVRITVTVQI